MTRLSFLVTGLLDECEYKTTGREVDRLQNTGKMVQLQREKKCKIKIAEF